MKRNWETIREILLKVEECTLPTDTVRLADFQGDRSSEISYHVSLLIEAGLINGQILQTLGPEAKEFFARGLTWHGHEFLDSIRSNAIWEATKKTFLEKGIEMTFELVRSGATQIASLVLKNALNG